MNDVKKSILVTRHEVAILIVALRAYKSRMKIKKSERASEFAMRAGPYEALDEKLTKFFTEQYLPEIKAQLSK